MRRVLVAGCGYLGRAVAQNLAGAGFEVIAWNRSGNLMHSARQPSFPIQAVDLSVAPAVEDHKFAADIVLHCASSAGGDLSAYRDIYLLGVNNLIRSFPSAHLVFTSSTSVYAQREGEWVTEESPAQPQTPKGRILREAETAVLGVNGTVLRVAGIYGPGRSALLRGVLARKAMRRSQDRFINQVHRDDIVSAILLLADRAVPGILNVVDDQPAWRSEILEWLSQRLGIPLSPELDLTPRRRGESNKRVSNARLRRAAWVPCYPNYQQAFESSILPSLAEAGC